MKASYAIWALLLVIAGAVGFVKPVLWPEFLLAGVMLIGWALWGAHVFGKGAHMELPNTWDENKITNGLTLYQNKGGGMLSQYIDGIVQRFIVGQNAQTLETRTKFLEKFNRYAEVAHQSYKWQAYMESGRAKMEEDIELLKVKIQKKRLEDDLRGDEPDPEIAALQKRVTVMQLQLQIATSEKAIADLNKAEEKPPAPPAPRSAREIREQKNATLTQREKDVQAALSALDEDTTLSEELRERKRNALEEKRAQIHEEQIALL